MRIAEVNCSREKKLFVNKFWLNLIFGHCDKIIKKVPKEFKIQHDKKS